jgi:hypothetical protein
VRAGQVAAVILLLASGCRQQQQQQRAWADCKATLTTPLRQLGPRGALVACRDRFRPACRDVLATATDELDERAGLALVIACARAYCPPERPLCAPGATLATARDGAAAMFADALASEPTATADERREVGALLAMQALPIRSLVVRLTVAGDGASIAIALEGGGDWAVPAHPAAADFEPLVAAARANGADLRGLLVWGADALAPDARRVFFAAMSKANIALVSCLRDGSNCR